MAPPKGNQFWKLRERDGRGKKFEQPEDLWNAAIGYFEWVEDNPLEEEKLFHFQGQVTRDVIYKMRPMTISGLCFYLGITEQNLREYEARDDFSGVVREIKGIIYNQKFAGAAADLMNPNIIARDLGLTDKKQLDHSGEMKYKNVSDDELKDKLKRLLDGGQ